MKRKFKFPLWSVWDVSVLFLILGSLIGTIAAVCFQETAGNGYAGIDSLVSKCMEHGTSRQMLLFFQVWLQRAGMAGMMWLAGMTPLALPAAWGFCFLLGMEQALLMAGFTGWGGIWGLPVFGATLLPQTLLYLPVFLILLSWSFARAKRIRIAGFLLLLLVLGMGAALEVWISPGLVRFLISRNLF